MRQFFTSRSCIVLFLLCVGQFAETTGFFWSSSYNSTEAFSRRTRAAESPIPIDCKLKSWTPWMPCDSSSTNETVRFQYLERPSQFGGISCVHSQWDKKLCPSQGKCKPQHECGDLYTCADSGRCISRHLLCNGEMDCQLGSDEEDCEDLEIPETKCYGMLPIPGAQKATQGYNALSSVFMSHVLDPKYFGGICEYIYNGEWRDLTYDALCEHLHYNDNEKYFRKPYNFLSYRLMAHALGQGSIEKYSDAVSLLQALKTEDSFNFGVTLGISFVEVGLSMSQSKARLTNISEYNGQDVEFVRLVSTVETAQFKLRSKDLMLDEDLLRSLLELPEQYNFAAYSRFINEYGTHYVTQGVMGGVLDYVAVLDRKVMKKSKLESHDVSRCLGVSLGLSIPIAQVLTGKLSVSHDRCKNTGNLERRGDKGDKLIIDVIGFVKGGTTGSSATQLAVHDAKSYRAWGKSLKHNPVIISFEALPIYELLRFSTAATQAHTRLPLLKRALDEYLEQFDPCRCASCRNNGVPVLTHMSCSCLCKTGYDGLACEKFTRESGPIHGAWSCWGSWSSCVSGTKTRRRECNNPVPQDNGFQCGGNSVQTKRC